MLNHEIEAKFIYLPLELEAKKEKKKLGGKKTFPNKVPLLFNIRPNLHWKITAVGNN